MKSQGSSDRLYTYVRWALVIGLVAGFVLLVGGTGLSLLPSADEPHSPVAWRDLAYEVGRLNPSAFLTLGVLLLFATPLARVVTALSFFALSKDWKFVLVSGLVLTILLVSIFSR